MILLQQATRLLRGYIKFQELNSNPVLGAEDASHKAKRNDLQVITGKLQEISLQENTSIEAQHATNICRRWYQICCKALLAGGITHNSYDFQPCYSSTSQSSFQYFGFGFDEAVACQMDCC